MRPVGNALAQTTFQQAGERAEVKVPQSTLIPRHHTRDDHHGNVHGLRSDVLWIHDIGGAAVPSTGNHGNQKAKLETGTGVESGVIFRAPPRRRPLARHIAEQGETPASFPIASLALSNVLSIFSEAGQLSQSRFLPALCSTLHGPVNIISVHCQLGRRRTRHEDDDDDDGTRCSESGSEKERATTIIEPRNLHKRAVNTKQARLYHLSVSWTSSRGTRWRLRLNTRTQ